MLEQVKQYDNTSLLNFVFSVCIYGSQGIQTCRDVENIATPNIPNNLPIKHINNILFSEKEPYPCLCIVLCIRHYTYPRILKNLY